VGTALLREKRPLHRQREGHVRVRPVFRVSVIVALRTPDGNRFGDMQHIVLTTLVKPNNY